MNTTANIALAIALVIIMLGMGLGLELKHFKNVFARPKALVTGLFNQLIFLPLIAYAIAIGLDLRNDLAIGLIIISACPGGAVSNIISHLAKGDVALSVSLTGVASLVTVISIPLVVNFGLSQFGEGANQVYLDPLESIGKIFVVTIVPISIGMLIRKSKPQFADRMEIPVRRLSTFFLFSIIAAITWKERAHFFEYMQMVGTAGIMLNVSTIFLGIVTARMMQLKLKQAITIAIESGIQNGTMAIMIATVMLNNTAFAIAPAVYSLLMFGTGFLLVYLSQMLQSRDALIASSY